MIQNETMKALNRFLHKNNAYLDFYWNYKHVRDTHGGYYPRSRKFHEQQGLTIFDGRSPREIDGIIDGAFNWNSTHLCLDHGRTNMEFWHDLYTKAISK